MLVLVTAGAALRQKRFNGASGSQYSNCKMCKKALKTMLGSLAMINFQAGLYQHVSDYAKDVYSWREDVS